MSVTFSPQLLSAYLDDALTPGERAEVERALAADARLRTGLEALRTASLAVRRMAEAEAEQVDFTGLADRVLARSRSGAATGSAGASENGASVLRLDPARARTSPGPEGADVGARGQGTVLPFRRRWIPAVTVGALAAAAAALLTLRPPPSAGVPGVQVQSATTDDGARLQPVVLKTESGDAIVWTIEHPDSGGVHAVPLRAPDAPAQTPIPKQERPKAGEL